MAVAYTTSSSSSSHPSPASSGSGSSVSSSLRTPPDLLFATAKRTSPQYHSWNALQSQQQQQVLRRKVLSRAQLERRRRLLSHIPKVPKWNLPAPPSSSAPTISASRYRSAARQLKHAADARSTSLPSYLAGRQTQAGALEQLDSVLLFCQSFYLDDADLVSDNGACVAKNWISLFGLLKHATAAQSELGNIVLLALCRVVESAVLRKLHSHDARLLQLELESSSSSTLHMHDLVKMVRQQALDLSKSERLFSASRPPLSLSNLAAQYPDTFEAAIRGGYDCIPCPSNEQTCRSFAYPPSPTTQFPHIVAFGRTLVLEHARRFHIDFTLTHP